MTTVEFLKEYDMKLDAQQEGLLCQQQHPVLIKGKTGSGKTLLFLNRIAYLMKSEIARKDEMLNIVFDKQCAKEMVAKYRYFFGGEDEIPGFTDIYSFAYQIIKRFYEKQGLLPAKAYRDLSNVVVRLCKDMFRVTIRKEQCLDLMGKISECRNRMLSENQMADIVVPSCPNIPFSTLYKEFVKFKDKKDVYDYDDILANCIELLMKNNDVLEETQQRCKFIHVDDAQEFPFLAHMLLKILSSNTTEMMVFADTDMTLSYTRAADPEALDAFEQTYPNAEVVVRDCNYRSNRSIVDLCNQFYYKDQDGLKTSSEETCEIKFKGFASLSKLYQYALRKVSEEEGTIAFLYRNFSMAVPLIELMKSNELSFRYKGNMKQFTNDPFVCDMWNFIELLIDPRDMRAFYEIYETLGLDISKRVLIEVGERMKQDDNVDVYQALMESSYKQAGKKKLASLIERIRMAEHKSTLDMIVFIKEKLGYNEYLRKNKLNLHDASILAFESLAQRYPDPDEFLYQLSALKDYQADSSSRIDICGLHDVRGNEYDHVYVLDCIRGILPYREDSDYERKIFFNGISKAKHDLEFLSTKRCANHRLEISPYLYELHGNMAQEKEVVATTSTSTTSSAPKKLRLTSLKRGVMIRHKQMGVGKIMKIADGMMHVKFDDGLKQMNMKLCIEHKLIELA